MRTRRGSKRKRGHGARPALRSTLNVTMVDIYLTVINAGVPLVLIGVVAWEMQLSFKNKARMKLAIMKRRQLGGTQQIHRTARHRPHAPRA